MGSGKSSTATFISLQLQWNGYRNRYIFEGEYPHPTKLVDHIPPPKTPEIYIEKSLEKWQQFVRTAQNNETVHVFDGQLFHGDMTEIMMMNAKDHLISQYIESLIDIVKPLLPTLIYFHQENIERAMRKIFAQRGHGWEHHQVEWKTNMPYCKARGLHGSQGLIQFYRDYRAFTDRLFSNIKIKKIDIENSTGQWPVYCKQILDFLGLEYYRNEVVVGDNDLSKVYEPQETDLFFRNDTDQEMAVYWLGFGQQKSLFYTAVDPKDTAKCRGSIGHFYAIKDLGRDQILETIFATDEKQTIVIQ